MATSNIEFRSTIEKVCDLYVLVALVLVSSLLSLPRAAYSQSRPTLDEKLFAATPAPNDPLVRLIQERLTKPTMVRARYEQRRYVAGLSKPLIAKGRFLYARGSGLAWIQEAPFTIAQILSKKGFAQKRFHPDGHTDLLEPPKSASTTEFSTLLLGIFGGSFSSLTSTVQFSASGTEHSWKIGIVPQSQNIGRFLKRVVLSGGETLEVCTIEEAQGDLVVTTLLEMDSSPTPLSSEEQAVLEW